MTAQYAYSFDEEQYFGPHDSIEAAMDAAIDHDEDASNVWIGEVVDYQPDVGRAVENLLEWLKDDTACSEHGEWADDWPNVSKEEQAELEKLIGDWLHRVSPADFFTVGKVKQYALRTGQDWWDNFWTQAESDMAFAMRLVAARHAVIWYQERINLACKHRGIAELLDRERPLLHTRQPAMRSRIVVSSGKYVLPSGDRP